MDIIRNGITAVGDLVARPLGVNSGSFRFGLFMIVVIVMTVLMVGTVMGLSIGVHSLRGKKDKFASGGEVVALQKSDQVYFGEHFLNGSRQRFTTGPELTMGDGTIVATGDDGKKYKVIITYTKNSDGTFDAHRQYFPWTGDSSYGIGGISVDPATCTDMGLGGAQDAWGWLTGNIGKEGMLSDDKLNWVAHGRA
jgi:hypothetical protein